MNWWLPHNFDKKRTNLEVRSATLKAIRAFFESRGFLEVQTPALQVCPTIDVHVHGFETELKNVDMTPKCTMYLHTSPEFDMKKILVSGVSSRIFQICQVFRNADGSKLHSPEFTLLEWYRADGATYEDIMDDSVDILRNVATAIGVEHYEYCGKISDPFQEWKKISVCEAFSMYCGIDLNIYINNLPEFFKVASEAGVRVVDGDCWDDIFHAFMAEKIEPNLGIGVPTILYDYPVSMASLSRRKLDNPSFAERFELYVCGVELANAFSELTDATEQRKRYEEDMAEKQRIYGETYPPDEEFFQALEHGLPECAGIALGVDRLVMLACGAENIEDVLWAPVQKD